MEQIYRTYYKSPIGVIEIKGTEKGILSVSFVDNIGTDKNIPILKECLRQIEQYFEGNLKEFSVDLIINGTEFQNRVWRELTKIPYGKTVAYKDIAVAVNSPKAVRAVGNTNRMNPIAIIVPCHRVIGSNGSLTGYAGGLWRKEWLLNHEKNFINL